jgi:hypothetical protein
MQTCGEFEVVREFASGRDASLYTTRAEGRTDAAGLAIKIWRFADSTPHALQAAAEQQVAIDAGCTRLAPIYSTGQTDEGCAYYVTSRYSLSIRGVLKAKIKVSAKFLERLCTDVLRALGELYEKRGRSHGNLKPGNILLDGSDPATMRAFLTDLAPEPDGATIPDDLYELGCIVYQIVRHREQRPNLNPPVEFDSEWESLGERADGWLAFCNLLLDRAGNSEPDAIHILLKKLRKIDALGRTAADEREAEKPPHARKRRSGAGAILALAVAVVLAIGGGYYFWKQNETTERPTVEKELTPQQLSDLKRAAQSEPEELRKLLEAFLRDQTRLRTETEFRTVMQRWSAANQLAVAVKSFDDRGWTQLRLSAARAGDFVPTREFASQFKAARLAAGEFDAIEERWDRLKALAQRLREVPEDSIVRLADWPQQSLAEVSDLTEAKRFTEQAVEQLGKVAAYVDGPWKDRVNQTRFRGESQIAQKVKVSPDEWLAEVGRFEREIRDDIVKWQERLREDDAALAKAVAPGSEPARAAAMAAQERIKNLEQSTVGALVFERSEIERKFVALEKEIDRLKQLAPPPPIGGATTIVVVDPIPPPAEDPEYVKFKGFLDAFKAAATNARTPQEAQSALTIFENSLNETPKYLARQDVKDFVVQLNTVLRPGPLTLPALSAKGWRATGKGEKDWAVYTIDGTGIDMPFHRVELQPGGESYAISAIEMPALIALRVRPPTQAPGDGPQVWQRTGDRVELARSFLWPTAQQGLMAIKRNYWDAAKPAPQLLAPGLQAAASAGAPLNFVSISDAVAMSQALGGDLPTADLWRRAHGMAQAAGWTSAPRLRGKAWQDQVAHLADLEKNARGAPPKLDLPGAGRNLWPDRGSYAPSGGNDGPAAGSAAGNELWFSASNRDSNSHPEGIYDLVGNIAEYVNDNGRAAIIGGSAISSPAVRVDVPAPVTSQRGYSDVGFRLAVRLGLSGGDQLAAFQQRVSRYLPPDPQPVP